MATTAKSRVSRQLLQLTVKKLIDDYIYRIDLDADYQREKIWTRVDQERLLDSIVRNIDIPKIYLAQVPDNENFEYECIDGKQRMATLLNFFKPSDTPLTVEVAGDKFTYKELGSEWPKVAKKIDDFELTFVIYSGLDDHLLRDIFRRLQLGVRLNSGELLKSHTGTLRDFIYKDMGSHAPFLRNTNLSEKRFSRQFTLAQICINSFSRSETGEFVRARYDDLEDFFKEKYSISQKDENLVRIRNVLSLMDKQFGEKAQNISSRAVAVSAYLFVERLYVKEDAKKVPDFVDFYVDLLNEIAENLQLLARFQQPRNRIVLEEFQKYISQASVEHYAIKRRDQFLKKAFEYYLDPRHPEKIINKTTQ